MLAGIPFGVGFLLIFMALLNYIVDAYEIFAASGKCTILALPTERCEITVRIAMSATSCCRSVFGAVLPIAARPMYNKMGIAWASSLLGFLSLGLTIIPFAFIKYGDRIRANSKFCQELKAKKAQAEAQRQRKSGLGRESNASTTFEDRNVYKEEV